MIDALNRDTDCVSLDRAALTRALETGFGQPGLARLVRERNPHMFAERPVFVDGRHLTRIAAVVTALETVAGLPAYRDAALELAPPAARGRDPGNAGLFLGLDFHIDGERISLIEINTNPGGALLSATLARAQRACSEAMRAYAPSADAVDAFEDDIVAMFLQEWRDAGRPGRPRRIAIVDDDPTRQYLYAEFLLFRNLLERAGIEACVVDPRELRVDDGALRIDGGHAEGGGDVVDMVYNRLTDFDFSEPAHAALRRAWEDDAAVIAPHPRAHALRADKRMLTLLCEPQRLSAMGADAATCALLAAHVPRTVVVGADNADALWAQRRSLFFKPWAGFGSRAAYRGAKLTRGVWSDICAARYVAQELAPPGERRVAGDEAGEQALKFDLRAYAYGGRVQWFTARLYRGQTTNFRTPGGGFAPVYRAPGTPDATAD